jgi:hypothetical protein
MSPPPDVLPRFLIARFLSAVWRADAAWMPISHNLPEPSDAEVVVRFREGQTIDVIDC